MIEKYRITHAHKDTLKILKGYPAIIGADDLLFNFINSTIAADGNGHKLYAESSEVSYNFGTGRFGQCSISVERSTANLITDSSVLDTLNFTSNWETAPDSAGSSAEKPLDLAGRSEYNIFEDGFGSTTAIVKSKNYIGGITVGDNLMQSCWVRTDATAVRFSTYSTTTDHHEDTWITLDFDTWYYITMTAPYIIQASDLASGGEIQEFYIETSASATKLYVFQPQTEIGDFSTAWVESSRDAGELVYSNSYFIPSHFSIGGWFYIKNFDGNRNGLFSICDDHGDLYRLTAYTDNTNNNKLTVKGSSTAQIFNMNTEYEVIEDTWFHVVLTFDGINYKCYIDGEIETTTTDTRKLAFRPAASLYIGTWYDQDILNGYANEFIISSRVIEDIEINHLYTNEMPLYNPYQYIAQV